MDAVTNIIGLVLVALGVGFTAFGVVAMFRFKSFYTRILTTAKIDTVGVITIVAGMAIRHGFSPFTGKILLVGVILFIFNPLVAHILARSAYLDGYQLETPENDTSQISKTSKTQESSEVKR